MKGGCVLGDGPALERSTGFQGLAPRRDPVWAAGGDCALGSMARPCVSHPLLSSQQTERLDHGYRPVTLGRGSLAFGVVTAYSLGDS